jgi:hypothetical protein
MKAPDLFREGGKLFFQIHLFIRLVVADSRSTKQFEHFTLRVDRRGIVHRRFAMVCRVFVVLSTLAAWLSISNHCAVGALIATQGAVAPMHCHGKSPSEKNSQGGMTCCKVLRATFVAGVKIVKNSNNILLPVPKWIAAELISSNKVQFHRVPVELDTGPPATPSFAESVLQRSLLVHAPPVAA